LAQAQSELSGIDPRGALRLKQILRLVPVTARCWQNWVRDGFAPPSFKLGATTCWRTADVLAFLDKAANTQAERDSA
jgi:predicted DNA-binding transcriptional regulator AlpA